MQYTNRSINDAGLAEIHAFLAARHKLGGAHFDRDMLRAWAADAERQLSEGNSATIEIKSWDSTSGHTEEFTVSDAGIDCHSFRIEAIEDNGGGLHLAVVEDGACTHFFSGFDHNTAKGPTMQEEIAAAADEGVDRWDGDSEDPQESYDYYQASEYGYRLIGEWEAGETTVYPEAMGNAGRRWARIWGDE